MAINQSIGEYIDSIPLMDILNNNPHFSNLKIMKGINGSPDYWEITFETNERSPNRLWVTFYGSESFSNFYKLYKLK